ncbi:MULTISPECIES: PilZ domain-containing protein [unclassified Lysobacter]
MNADEARAAVFGDSLTCQEVRPVAFVPGALDESAQRVACARAEALLRAIALVEDSRTDDPDERGTQELGMQRIEAKLDLLTALVATLVGNRDTQDHPQSVRWSALGVCLAVGNSAADVAPGTVGVFRVLPCDWLPQALELPATVLASVADGTGRQLWLRFQALPATLASALERHLFRVHRRAIAESRRPR